MAKSSAKVRGITIQINGDTSGLAKAISSVNAELKHTQSDLRDVEKLLNLNPSNVELLRQKEKLLNDEIAETKERLSVAWEALGRLSRSEATPEVTRQMEALRRQIIEDTNTLDNLERELEEFGSVGKQQALQVAQQWVELGESISGVGASMANVGKQWTRKVSAPIYAAGQNMVSSAMDYETAIAKVKAISLDATDEEIQRLEQDVLALSKTTIYSADEIAEAVYYESLAGWDLNKSLEALPQLLDLAAAGNVDLGRASDIVTDYMTAFNMSVDQSTRFVDVMAATMSNSNTTVDLMGETFKYVAPVAGSMGYEIEDVALAIGLMASQGIKGSQAGTALRMMMQRLAVGTGEASDAMKKLGISITDDNGNMKSFRQVMDNIRSAFGQTNIPAAEFTKQLNDLDAQLEDGTLSEEEYEEALYRVTAAAYGVNGAEKAKLASQIAGVRGMTGFLAIINTTEEAYKSLAGAINESTGSAEEMRDIMLDTTAGRLELLKHDIQAFSIEMGERLIPTVEKVMEKIKGVVEWFTNLDDGVKNAAISMALIVAAGGPILTFFGSVTQGIGSVITLIGKAKTAWINHAEAIIPFLTGPGGIAVAIAAVVGLVVSLGVAYAKAQKEAHDALIAEMGLTDEQKKRNEAIKDELDALEERKKTRAESNKAIELETQKTRALWERLQDLVDAQGFVQKGRENEVSYILNELSEATGIEAKLIGQRIKGYEDLKASIEDVIAKQQIERLLSTNEEEYYDYLYAAEKDYIKLQEIRGDIQKQNTKRMTAEIKLAKTLEEMTQYPPMSLELENYYANQIKNYQDAVKAAEEGLNDLKKAEEDIIVVIEEKSQFVESYEKLNQAAISGTTAEMKQQAQVFVNSLKTYDKATKEELEEQYKTLNDSYERLKKAYERGEKGVSELLVKTAKERRDAAKIELDKTKSSVVEAADETLKGIGAKVSGNKIAYSNNVKSFSKAGLDAYVADRQKYEQAGTNSGTSIVKGFSNGATGGISKSAQTIYSSFEKIGLEGGRRYNSSFATGIGSNIAVINKKLAEIEERIKNNSLYSAGKSAGANYGQGLADGLKSKADTVAQASANLANNQINKKVHKVLGINSPAKEGIESGEYYGLGLAMGLSNMFSRVASTTEKLGTEITSGMNNILQSGTGANGRNVGEVTKQTTNNLGGINITINAAQGQSEAQIADMVSERINREVMSRKAAFA